MTLEPPEISIPRAILHLTEPDGRGFEPSLQPFVPDEDVARFLAGHIEKSLKDSSLRTCAFVDPIPSSIGGWLTVAAASDDEGFVELTTKIAKQLHTVMEGNRSISDGSLVVASYRVGNDVEPSLALLKMDPGPGFATESTDGTNTITKRGSMLPSTRERLHKCAFVEPSPDGPTLTVLDLQRDGKGKIRTWFLSDYLEASLALTDEELTRDFYNAAFRGSQNIEDEVRQRQFRASLVGAISGTRVNVSTFLDNADLEDQERKEIDAALRSRLGSDREFSVDPHVRDALLSRLRFTGDDNLKLTVPSTTYETAVTVTDRDAQDPQSLPPQTRKFRITSDTDQWRQTS